MGDVIKFKRPPAAKAARKKTLCRHGFHKWSDDPTKQFDVKKGRLVSVFRCVRCGLRKTTVS